MKPDDDNEKIVYYPAPRSIDTWLLMLALLAAGLGIGMCIGMSGKDQPPAPVPAHVR